MNILLASFLPLLALAFHLQVFGGQKSWKCEDGICTRISDKMTLTENQYIYYLQGYSIEYLKQNIK